MGESGMGGHFISYCCDPLFGNWYKYIDTNVEVDIKSYLLSTKFLYSDKEYKNLITNYNYRHVHRKEVIEIRENFIENYYILINSNDSAFVEIKYETDFYNRGYMRMNPNEVNIEFVNKENDFIPFEVNNPDYFSEERRT